MKAILLFLLFSNLSWASKIQHLDSSYETLGEYKLESKSEITLPPFNLKTQLILNSEYSLPFYKLEITPEKRIFLEIDRIYVHIYILNII